MQMAEFPNLIPVMPEIFLALMGMALLMLGVFSRATNQAETFGAARLTNNLGIAALVLTVLLVLTVAGPRMTVFQGLFVVDPFATFFKVLMLVAGVFALVMSQDYMEKRGVARFEYAIVVLFATLGMLMMVSANNLMSLYLGLELQSLSLYVLAAFVRDDNRSVEAGIKYFVLGSLASGFLLYGMSMVYGFTGTTDFDQIAASIAASGDHGVPAGLVVGMVFMLAGMAFKVSAAPFHMWTPDVYEGAPTPVTAFFAVGPKLAAIALLLRVMMGPFAELSTDWTQVVVLIAVASLVVGSFAAIMQTNIKRMMAYSSIGHVGYALIGLATGSESGIQAVLVYMGIYLFMNIGTFAIILSMRRGERQVESIHDLAGLSKSNPLMAAALAVMMFSMAGIPPLAGFFGKLTIFLAAMEAHMYTLAIIGVLASVVSAFFYLRIIRIAYFDEAGDALDVPVGRAIGFVTALSTVLVVGFFLFPSPLMGAASIAAQSLF